MSKQNKALHTAFSTEFRAREKAVAIYLKTLFAGTKKWCAWLAVYPALVVALAAGLVACGSDSKDTSSASLVMEMQYYDTLWNIYEVPVITGDESQPAQAINTELLALEEIWQAEINTAYEHVNNEVVAFPSTTDRYLNIVLLQMSSGTGSDGTVYSWVYDKAESRRVTADEALALAGVTVEELRAQIADSMAAETPYAFAPASMELAGFRIRPDGKPEIYLYGTTEYRTLPEGGELDPWRRLYIWADGEFIRGINLFSPEYTVFPFRLLVPAEETDATDAPLWCVWAPAGGEPAGGFTEPPAESRDAAWESIVSDWESMPEYSLLMSGTDYGEWSVGIGKGYEFGLGIPFDYLGSTQKPSDGMTNTRCSTVNAAYYEGLTVWYLSDFYDDPALEDNGIPFTAIWYISCTTPEAATARGISVGNPETSLETAYPNHMIEYKDFVPPANCDLPPCDSLYVYAPPDGTNRSLLFLAENGVIVRIDVAEGFDEKRTTPMEGEKTPQKR